MYDGGYPWESMSNRQMFFFFDSAAGLSVGAAILHNVVEPTTKGLKWVTTTTNLKLLAGDSFADTHWAKNAQVLCK